MRTRERRIIKDIKYYDSVDDADDNQEEVLLDTHSLRQLFAYLFSFQL
jgi:5-methylcytosine-specific restriction endonuclease McrBC regulatory subunit McrC